MKASASPRGSFHLFLLQLNSSSLQLLALYEMAVSQNKSQRSSDPDINLQNFSRVESPARPLLDDGNQVPRGWPITPAAPKQSLISTLSDIAMDLLLIGISLAFMALALIVQYYDQAPISLHQRTFDALTQATKYVRPYCHSDGFRPC